jgi:hypothetical protein
VPGEQSVQRMEFEGDQLPGSQIVQLPEEGDEYEPAEQTLQALIDSAPVVALNVPAAHDKQLEESLAPVYGR